MPQNNPPTRDALVIGIGKYTDLTPRELPELVNDAEKIAQLLETKGGFRVRRLPATQPDDKEFIDPEQTVIADELKSAIEQLLMPKSEHLPTTALLFFAGHGLLKEIKESHSEGFLATSEANPAEDEWGISLQWLRELLEKSPIPQQIVWLDACYSGLFQTVKILETSKVLDHERCFITSARAHEEAYAVGVLTNALLETLDYTKQLNPWVDHLTLIEWLKVKNQTAAGSQRFVFANTDKPIILTNKAFDVGVDYKNICPFKGLEYFDFEKNPDDPLYFKGRTDLTNELLEKVQSANFLAVLGASGNGKSSVVRAGLLYQLRQTQRWEILPVITPTADPLKALGTVIGMPAAQLTDSINQSQTERQVLVIDQFEELFTVCKNDAEREQFLATLLAAVARADNKFCLVVVMRADFLDKCSQHVDLAKKIQAHQIIVTPMTTAELEEAIVAPTQQVGFQIEPKLVPEMLADVKGVLGSLPLLQYTLTELWQKCAAQRLLTFSAYEELGRIKGTLEKRANAIYEALSVDKQKIAKQIFLELVEVKYDDPATRKRVTKQYLITTLKFTHVNETLEELIKARLVATLADNDKIEIIHEALIHHWSRLNDWIQENRVFMAWRDHLQERVKEWEKLKKDKGCLLSGIQLSGAEEKLKEYDNRLSSPEKDYIEKSIESRQEEIDERERSQQELNESRERERQQEIESARRETKAEKRTKIWLASFLTIVVLLFFMNYIQWLRTENQSQIMSLTFQGEISVEKKSYPTALEHFKEALSISKEIGDDLAEAKTLSLIGKTYTILNENEKALRYYKEAVNTYRVFGNVYGERSGLDKIVKILINVGQVQQADHYRKQIDKIENKPKTPLAKNGNKTTYTRFIDTVSDTSTVKNKAGILKKSFVSWFSNLWSAREQKQRYVGAR